MSAPADPCPTPTTHDRLIDTLIAAGITDLPFVPGGLGDLLNAFKTTLLRMAFVKPCPSAAGLNPNPPTPGAGYTFNFSTSTLPHRYRLTVIKIGSPNSVVFNQTVLFNTGATLNFSIPAKIAGTANDTFVVNADYLFVLSPIIIVDGMEVSIGCVQSPEMTTRVENFYQIIFAALALWNEKKC